jgi:hypothetical protein
MLRMRNVANPIVVRERGQSAKPIVRSIGGGRSRSGVTLATSASSSPHEDAARVQRPGEIRRPPQGRSHGEDGAAKAAHNAARPFGVDKV